MFIEHMYIACQIRQTFWARWLCSIVNSCGSLEPAFKWRQETRLPTLQSNCISTEMLYDSAATIDTKKDYNSKLCSSMPSSSYLWYFLISYMIDGIVTASLIRALPSGPPSLMISRNLVYVLKSWLTATPSTSLADVDALKSLVTSLRVTKSYWQVHCWLLIHCPAESSKITSSGE